MNPNVVIVFLAGFLLGAAMSLPANKNNTLTAEVKDEAAPVQADADDDQLEKRLDKLERALVPTDLLGWTVFQRRMDGSVNFYRNWNEYVNGFGDPAGEFWMGLYKIGELMKNGTYELRIDMQDFDGNWKYAYYKHFHVGDKHDNYLLTVSGYIGNAGDSLRSMHNNMPFSTKDRDHDTSRDNCAQKFKGGWWYSACHYANLNGRYLRGAHDTYADGVNWYLFRRTHNYSLKYVEMKMRRKP